LAIEGTDMNDDLGYKQGEIEIGDKSKEKR
jgi:hypothetical protein